MPATLEKQLENAKKAVEVAKKNYKNAKSDQNTGFKINLFIKMIRC